MAPFKWPAGWSSKAFVGRVNMAPVLIPPSPSSSTSQDRSSTSGTGSGGSRVRLRSEGRVILDEEAALVFEFERDGVRGAGWRRGVGLLQ